MGRDEISSGRLLFVDSLLCEDTTGADGIDLPPARVDVSGK